jgi:hypothetical protein
MPTIHSSPQRQTYLKGYKMEKLFKFSGGALIVRADGFGVENKSPITGEWSVLFLSSFSNEETAALLKLVRS